MKSKKFHQILVSIVIFYVVLFMLTMSVAFFFHHEAEESLFLAKVTMNNPRIAIEHLVTACEQEILAINHVIFFCDSTIILIPIARNYLIPEVNHLKDNIVKGRNLLLD